MDQDFQDFSIPSYQTAGESSKSKQLFSSVNVPSERKPLVAKSSSSKPQQASRTVSEPNLSASGSSSGGKRTSPGTKSKTSLSVVDPKDRRIMAIKSTINDIWEPKYLRELFDLVHFVNTVVTHTYALSKFIFLREVRKDPKFRLQDYINKDFFVEVFLSLVARGTSRPNQLKDVTTKYRHLIYQHHKLYCQAASYTPLARSNAQQMALYECVKVKTAYDNNIKAH